MIDTLTRLFRRTRSVLGVSLLLTAALTATLAPNASADDFNDRASRAYREFPKDRQSDLVILPLLVKVAPPPRIVDSVDKAMLLPAGAAGWSDAVTWATGEPQKALLQGLSTVTKETDWKKAFGFAQPYGIEGVPIDLIQAGMYTDLGDPPTLAAARLGYLKRFDTVSCLVNVEVTRLTAEGKVNEAIDILTHYLYFGRQMCDREMYRESLWGMNAMMQGYERIRDALYVDSKTVKKLDAKKLDAQIKGLRDQAAYLDMGRMKFPAANRLAAEQLLARVYKKDGSIDERVFAATMSRLTSTERPLRLFSESGKWRTVGAIQIDRTEANRQLGAVYDDWENRWKIPYFDKRLANVSPYDTLMQSSEKAKNAALLAATPPMNTLYELRHLLAVENLGTRSAMAIVAHASMYANFPPQLTSVRPTFLASIEPDPYSPPDARNGARNSLQFFVPIRDTAAIDGEGKSHEIEVVAKEAPFKVLLKDDIFVLYSAGSDEALNNARRVQNTYSVVQGADYLLYPPVLSLSRQNLMDRGDLK